MATYQGKIIDIPLVHAVRNPQVKTGFFTNGEGQQSGGDTIKTPRKTPLEVSWKRANPTAFE